MKDSFAGTGMVTMISPSLRSFRQVAIALRLAAMERGHTCTLEEAQELASQYLSMPVPSPEAWAAAMREPEAKRARGRPFNGSLTSRDAVGAVATYFETIGARKEQAINEARRWLGADISRKVAKAAAAAFKLNTPPGQYRVQAQFAYAKFAQSTLPLPESLTPFRRRRAKSHLG